MALLEASDVTTMVAILAAIFDYQELEMTFKPREVVIMVMVVFDLFSILKKQVLM